MKKETFTRRIWVDIDGVLLPFDKSKTLEEVGRPGYSLTLPIIQSIKECVRALFETGYEVGFLSAVLNDYAIADKTKIIRGLPYGNELLANTQFVKYGESKTQYLLLGDILIDDFSDNLREWELAGGVGIKVYNGINGTKGTWQGYSIHSTARPSFAVNQLLGILSAIDRREAVA